MTDKNAQAMYAAIKSIYPDRSIRDIERMMNVGRSSMSRLKAGNMVGVEVGKWLAKHHPQHKHLYAKALATKKATWTAAVNNRKTAQPEVSEWPTQWWPAVAENENSELTQS